MNVEAFVLSTGMVCAIGNGAPQCSASFRADLSGYILSPVLGRAREPLRIALVPEPDLEPLAQTLYTEALADRERRMLRLAGMALRQIEGFNGPLFLALPETRTALGGFRVHPEFVQLLGLQTGARFDPRMSKTFELGRAGGFFALKAALAALAAGATQVLVGGVETFLDLRLLAALDAERRLLADDVRDGFTPGEAAAFLSLTRKHPRRATTVIRAVGTAHDPGHRYSDEPAHGVGLAAALDDAQWRSARLPAVRTCFAGLNGESFGAKAWGVAHVRHHALFDPALAFEHPADVYGDVGAATATVLLALADETLRNDQRPGPALVWAASDHAPCGAAYLAAAE
ncbi:MAG: fabB [Myxococcaceae bacterium]|nr:fabB [Myxococcaceae bacterium]